MSTTYVHPGAIAAAEFGRTSTCGMVGVQWERCFGGLQLPDRKSGAAGSHDRASPMDTGDTRRDGNW